MWFTHSPPTWRFKLNYYFYVYCYHYYNYYYNYYIYKHYFYYYYEYYFNFFLFLALLLILRYQRAAAVRLLKKGSKERRTLAGVRRLKLHAYFIYILACIKRNTRIRGIALQEQNSQDLYIVFHGRTYIDNGALKADDNKTVSLLCIIYIRFKTLFSCSLLLKQSKPLLNSYSFFIF